MTHDERIKYIEAWFNNPLCVKSLFEDQEYSIIKTRFHISGLTREEIITRAIRKERGEMILSELGWIQ